MKVEVFPSQLRGRLPAISSKSDAHRVLISAALAKETTTIKTNTLSEDMIATIEVIRSFGATVTGEDTNLLSVAPPHKLQAKALAPCKESGSTLRFLLPVAAALGIDATFTGAGKLPERPLEPLLQELKRHGISTNRDTLPLTITGQLQGGIYRLPGDISSQYISGLLFALPLLKDGSIIELTTPLQSGAYLDMTLDTLKKFGITVLKKDNTYVIPGEQEYRSPLHCEIEGDWSNTAFWLCGAALSDSVTVTGLSFTSRQGDKAIIHRLLEMGATVVPTDRGYGVIAAPLCGTVIDAKEIPDLVPILAVTATAAKGTTKIINAQRLRWKECDRLHAMTENLKILGGNIEETDDGLIIKGGAPLTGGIVSSFHDHRIAMAMTIAALNCKETMVIEEAGAIAKSYPNFYQDFIKLGGKLHVL